MTMDEAKNIFDSLCIQWSPILGEIDNEADTRFKLIDQILTKVLEWQPLDDFSLERYGESGFADYVLSADGRDRMVVEAKRLGSVLVDTAAGTTQFLAVKSVALKNAQSGLKQAQSYCVDTGITFAVLTSGTEWIAYLAIREHGKKPSEGKVIVFPSLNAISQDFSQFWDLFSRTAVVEERYKIRIREIEGLRVQSSEVLKPILKTGDIKFLPKSQLAIDLDRVFKEFFSSMAGQNDPEMLAQCFVESKESKEADVNLEKIASSLISRLEKMSSAEGEQLQRRMQSALESQHGEFILIIGNKGAGKTTFIDRFFRLVLQNNLRDACAVVRVDVGDSTGDPSSIVSWLDDQMLHTLERDLFENGRASNDQLQGIFYSEYCRWKEGPHKILYESDKAAFKIKFGEYLEELRTKNVHSYVERLLKDIVDNRKKMPCLVFDNTDHFSAKFQEAVFQYAQSLFRTVFSFVICPITDRTIWGLSKHGPLQSYDSTAFYLPVPAMKSILEKRINFIRNKLQDSVHGTHGQYFVGRGIRIKVQDIEAFASCVEEIFVTNEGVSRIIGSLANFDIRRSLQLSQRIVTSPHVKIDDLVKLYLTDGNLPIRQRAIHLGILCGDANHFSQESSHYVVNTFEIQGDDLTSPILKIGLLRFFMDVENQNNQDALASHASVEDAINYFDSMGISKGTIKWHLQRLASALLLSTYDAAEEKISEDSRLRITPSGKMHYEWALNNSAYITEAALSTPLRSGLGRDDLVTLWTSEGKKSREDWDEFVRKFAEYCLEQDKVFSTVPAMASYSGQKALRDQFRARWAPPMV
jgi:hypothetical protein